MDYFCKMKLSRAIYYLLKIQKNQKKRMLFLLSSFEIATVCTYSLPVEPDTLSISKELNEVVVTASQNQIIGNKQFFYPSKELKQATNNGVQLLAGLQVPDLIIDPASGSIEKLGGGEISLRINGRPASQIDLTSISPKDIIKVEYISDPGLRYGEAKCVIDITVKRRETGYGISLNLLQSVNRGWGNYTGALKYTSGRSEWTLDCQSNPMWRMSSFRDNTERYILSDGTVIYRAEEGVKTPNRMATHRAALQYSYSQGNKLLFNTQLRLFRKNDRYVSEGDITNITDNETIYDFEREVLPIKSTQIDLDIYLHYKINKGNKIYFNVIPTIINGSNSRIYETSDTELHTTISNNGYRLLGEGIWESRIGNGMISTGLRSLGEWNNATYDNNVDFVEKNFTGYIFAEWKQTLDKIQYSIGFGGTLHRVIEPMSHSYFNTNSRLFLRYAPFQWGGISLIGNVNTISPTVNQLNPILQQVDRYQWSKGNPDVSAFQQYEAKIEFDGRVKDASFKLTVGNTYCSKPVMGAKTYIEDKIVKTFYNCGYNNNFTIEAQLRFPIFIKQLSLSLAGGWHKAMSKGLNYKHEYNQPFINAQIMYVNGAWWAMIKYNTTYNTLWGEDIFSNNNNMLNIGIGYTYRNATFMAGAFNPVGNISVKSRDLSAIAGYDREYQVSSTKQLFWIGVTLNIYKGKKRGATKQKLNNSKMYESINNVKK